MIEIEVALPDTADDESVVAAVEEAAGHEELSVTMKGRLASYSGSTHWHFKRGKERGTLEATYWPARRRLWLSIQAGRTAAWVEECASRLRGAIEFRLGTGRTG
jgi:hypothetical protein